MLLISNYRTLLILDVHMTDNITYTLLSQYNHYILLYNVFVLTEQ